MSAAERIQIGEIRQYLGPRPTCSVPGPGSREPGPCPLEPQRKAPREAIGRSDLWFQLINEGSWGCIPLEAVLCGQPEPWGSRKLIHASQDASLP